jgi:hypothetical protein
LFVVIREFLPAHPVTRLTGQSHSAQAAFLKTALYLLYLNLLFFLLTFHAVLVAQRERSPGRIESLLRFPPRGLSLSNFWVLLALFVITAVVALLLHHSLMSQLAPDPNMNLFSLLIYQRLILFFCFGAASLVWYHHTLTRLKQSAAANGPRPRPVSARSRRGGVQPAGSAVTMASRSGAWVSASGWVVAVLLSGLLVGVVVQRAKQARGELATILALEPVTPPRPYKEFCVRIDGATIDPATARVVVTGPGCERFGGCVVPNDVLHRYGLVTGSQVERVPLRLAPGKYLLFVQNGPHGERLEGWPLTVNPE